MGIITLRDISKTYGGSGGQTAVDQVNLNIEEGEFVAIMGPSGSGKTTILSIIGGLAHPTFGKVLIDEIDIYGLNQEDRADFRREYLGFVFQEYQLVPYLSAGENVMLPLTITDVPKITHAQLAADALDTVHLKEKFDRLPSQMSNGEQERVAIARAIINRPPIILADEPTGSLDTQNGHDIIDLFKELNTKEGLTIVMVTHDPEDAMAASRIIRVRDGALA